MGALSGLLRSRGLGAATDWSALAQQWGDYYQVDPSLILAVIEAESSGNPNAVNPRDPSYGLMGVTLATASWMLGRPVSAAELLDPVVNVQAGTAYLAWQQARHGSLAEVISGYNAGTPTDANQSYVARVFGFLESLVSGGTAVAAPSSDAATEAPSSPIGLPGAMAGLTAWIGAYWPWLAGGAVVLYLARRR